MIPAEAVERRVARHRLCEVLLIFMVFFLYAGWVPPAVNEAHYLTKAKHYWNPDFCAGDHFLESADAHLVFYWTFGWVTLFCSLPGAAWIGRLVTWGAMAWAWRRLSWCVVPKPYWGLLSATLFVVFSHHCQMAGEWVIGGVEAKGFAYVLVMLALEAIARDRWRRVWILLGIATAFHVLVGGWSMVAAGIAWLLAGPGRPSARSQCASWGGGILIALLGLVPGLWLTWGVDPDVAAQANDIYVFRRLSHHLVMSTRPLQFIAAHLALFALWLLLNRTTPATMRIHRLRGFVWGAVAIASVGLLFDLFTPDFALAARILRYYWFRLTDVVLPMGTALAVVGWLAWRLTRRPVAGRWALLATMVVAGAALVHWNLTRRCDPRPSAALEGRDPARHDIAATTARYRDWFAVCQWIGRSTDAGDRFLTPLDRRTFKWHAGRAEVVTWKDIPQDAAGVVQWWERLRSVRQMQRANENAGAQDATIRWALSDGLLFNLARRFSCRYIVVDAGAASTLPNSQHRVYPTPGQENAHYAVYLVPGETTDGDHP